MGSLLPLVAVGGNRHFSELFNGTILSWTSAMFIIITKSDSLRQSAVSPSLSARPAAHYVNHWAPRWWPWWALCHSCLEEHSCHKNGAVFLICLHCTLLLLHIQLPKRVSKVESPGVKHTNKHSKQNAWSPCYISLSLKGSFISSV